MARRSRPVPEYFTPPPPRVLAHRGLATAAPENTLLAFLNALKIGATHLETDVQVSADGRAIVSHDPQLTRLVGRDVRIDQLTVAELRRIDLGSGQGFSTLAEVLDAFPDARVNIDIKAAGAADPAAADIRSLKAEHRVLIGSFSASRRLATVRQLPGVATSASARGVGRRRRRPPASARSDRCGASCAMSTRCSFRRPCGGLRTATAAIGQQLPRCRRRGAHLDHQRSARDEPTSRPRSRRDRHRSGRPGARVSLAERGRRR